MDSTQTLIGCLILLSASAFFSGAEVSLFSLDKKRMEAGLEANPFLRRYILRLLDAPKRLLITILIGNTLVNIFLSIITLNYALALAKVYGWERNIVITGQIIIATVIVLIFGEVTPKVLAAKRPLLYAKIFSVPLYLISVILYPIAELLNEFIKIVTSKISFIAKFHTLSRDEISFLATVGHEAGTIEGEEHDLIRGLVSTKTTIVREIMVHRTEMRSIQYESSLSDIISVVQNSKHSRLPVLKGNQDSIAGILYVKDLLKYIENKTAEDGFSIEDVLRKPIIVPETKLINELMKDFQSKKQHLAIVVDEYGGTAGVVTLEDIIEEVIGEIRIENNSDDDSIQQTSDKKYIVKGELDISEFAEKFNLKFNFESKEFDTAAGWVYNKIEKIPAKSDSFIIGEYKVTILEIKNNRIKLFSMELQ